MPYDFSFNTRQWWTLVAACVLILILTLVIGVIAGVMWTRFTGASHQDMRRTVPLERSGDRGSKPDATPSPSVDTAR
jgi:MFS superfamily sulfate permease-like transporter